VGHVVVAAGVDAAADLDLQLAHLLGPILVGELGRDVLGDRDGAGIGQGAVVQARAGDDVAGQVDIGVARPAEASAAWTAGMSSSLTCGKTRFWAWVTRRSLKPYRSARSATRSSWSAVASPGVWPWAFSEISTMA
jgi:hypothetical protein